MADEKNNNLTDEEIEENEDVEDQDTQEGSGKSGDDKGKGAAGKSFTQEQVTKMMAREKSQGRNSAFKDLGIDPKDTKTMNMVKAFLSSQKSDEEKAAEKQKETETAKTEAEQRAVLAEAKVEVMMLGVKPQYVDDAVALAMAKMTEDSDLKTIIGEFKAKYPIWFTETEEDEDKDDKDGKGVKGKSGTKDTDKSKDGKDASKTGQRGTGSSIKSDKGKGKDDEEKSFGARLAAQRRTQSGKKSYWGNNK